MSELRQDPTTEEWVIITTERLKRPSDLVHVKTRAQLLDYSQSCPFCPGNEHMTPPATLSYQKLDKSGWRLRVISNQFPALKPEGNTTRKIECGLFMSLDGVGIHEVVIEAPEHNKTIAMQNNTGIIDLLSAYRERYLSVSQMPFVKLVMIYKNYGEMAGTTLEHSHSQLLATSIMPKHMRIQYEIAARYYDNTGQNLYTDIIKRELESGKRLIMETKSFVAFHPFASHSSFETWIVPKSPQSSFGNITTTDIEELAPVLKTILRKLSSGLGNPDFNYVIDSAPVDDENKDYYLWHIRIFPRLIEQVGFELGSGINLNTALPEETAKFMRELKIE